jgi:ketosteroid isomerase-like protein
MSQENVEVIRGMYEAWQPAEPRAAAEFLDPEIEWDVSAYPGLDMPVRGKGRENYLRLLDRYVRAWINYEVTPTELIDVGDDVVVVQHETARARGTEMPIDRDLFGVWTVREGRVIRVRGYRTKREALEAAGLPPRPA